MLQLIRPLIFVDFESTGTDVKTDLIVEYSFCKLLPDGEREIKTGYFNPGRPIPPAATEVHKITDEMVKNAPTFKQKAKGILEFISGCDLAGFNSNRFDFPLLHAEFARAGIVWDHTQHQMIDVGNIFKIKEERTLSAAYNFYCGKSLDGAHSAEVDILATVEVLQGQFEKYDDLPTDMQELEVYSNFGKKRLDLAGAFVYADDGETILFNIGKNKGQKADDYGFLRWMVFTADFPADTKKIATELMNALPVSFPGR